MKQVITSKHTGTNGMPAAHSKFFIRRSNTISGNITATHVNVRIKSSAMMRKKNLNAEVEFYLNPGNHFMEPDARLGRAIDSLAAHINGKNY